MWDASHWHSERHCHVAGVSPAAGGVDLALDRVVRCEEDRRRVEGAAPAVRGGQSWGAGGGSGPSLGGTQRPQHRAAGSRRAGPGRSSLLPLGEGHTVWLKAHSLQCVCVSRRAPWDTAPSRVLKVSTVLVPGGCVHGSCSSREGPLVQRKLLTCPVPAASLSGPWLLLSFRVFG